MEAFIYIGLAAVALAIFIYQTYIYTKSKRERLLKHIREAWGNRPEREYSFEEFDNLTHYYLNNDDGNFKVDDITWNDLDMDTIFMLLNNTNSSVGEEYLYNMLRRPSENEEDLKERDRVISFFEGQEDKAIEVSKIFANLGRTKKISFFEYFLRLLDLNKRSNSKHLMCIYLLIASISLIFIFPPVGIVAAICIITFNIVTYYQDKAEVENYFICMKFIVNLISTGERLIKLDYPELSKYTEELNTEIKKLSAIKKGIGMITANNMSGNLGDVFMDYVRMITHIDLIKFNSMHEKVITRIDTIKKLYRTTGFIEASIAIASFRKMVPYYSKPEFSHSCQNSVDYIDVYHPMIEEPVANTIKEDRSVLLTGSNASGKSTFLKTVAINAILAQTIYTTMSNGFRSPFYKVYSSMALRDDLSSSESYFIVEIKSLKRILDSVDNGEHVLCFVDEVLRGTNTVERIAASSRILKSLSDKGAMCFAATHDVELTHILEKYFSNYHFQETVSDDDVIFDYILHQGRASSRNAIKLLSVMGYDKKLIDQAENSAQVFLNTGAWSSID